LSGLKLAGLNAATVRRNPSIFSYLIILSPKTPFLIYQTIFINKKGTHSRQKLKP
jgi:hypothetical protein